MSKTKANLLGVYSVDKSRQKERVKEMKLKDLLGEEKHRLHRTFVNVKKKIDFKAKERSNLCFERITH